MANLYELAAGYESLVMAYENAETDEERGEILDLLVSADGDIQSKAENYAKLIRRKASEAEAYRAEAKRLTGNAQAAENLVERLKEALRQAMQMTGKSAIETSIGKWRLQLNPVSVKEVLDINLVPMKYHVKHEDTVDKKSIIADYKATGEIIPGVEIGQESGLRFR